MALEIWTEKYRPQKLSDIAGQENIVARLKNFVGNESIPHMLFAGPAGIGKTTAALCIARELYGEEWRQNYMDLNASDERGIDVIRNKVKDFARTRTVGEAPFKIIFLDEADSLTPEAQQALRRTMENYTETCRFILAANYSSKIIDPIQSRCAVFRFTRLSDEVAKAELKNISEAEDLEVTEGGLDALLHITRGDMRRAINLLQSAAAMDREITEDNVFEVAAQARPGDIQEMIENALDGEFNDSREALQGLLIDRGIAGEDIIKQIHRTIYTLDIQERRKMKMIETLGEYEFRLDSGGDPMIQLESYLAQLGNL